MYDIEIAYIWGFGLCINYSNEDIEGTDKIADDLRHTIQIVFFIIIININYYTDDSE